MHPMLNIAIRAVRKAGDLVIKYYEKSASLITTSKKSSNIFFDHVSKNVESIITSTIKKFYPQHTFYSNGEDIWNDNNQNVQWIIDPLNGALNFIRLFPHFAISIAGRIRNRTEVAVIYDPIRNELFTAIRGQGAQLNNYRIRSKNTNNLDCLILATGFPFKIKQHVSTYMNILSKLSATEFIDFRKTGSSALDLAYVGAGRINGYFEIGLKIWNFAAGELIAREAGALICDFSGGHNYFLTGNIVAGELTTLKIILANTNIELS